MPSETVANLNNLLREVWTDDRLNRQFYDGTRWLDKVEKTNKYTIGRQASVPVELSLPGGTSSVPVAGSSALNAPDALHVDRGIFTLTQQWHQVSFEAAALAQGAGGADKTTVDTLDQSIESHMTAFRKDINRMAVSNGDALIAGTLAGAADTTVLLDPAKYGYDAIVRGWIRPGMVVDVGTTANEVSVGNAVTVNSVTESAAAPAFVASGSVTETGTTYVSVSKARSGTTSYEPSGLRTLFGSATTVIGGIDPATNSYWKPASVDTTTTAVSLQLLLDLQRGVYQKTGGYPTYVTTSPKQAAALYALFENQVRFAQDAPKAGNVEGFSWNGMSVNPDPDIPDQELYLLNLKDICVITAARYGKPTWATAIQGTNQGLIYAPGTTAFKDAIYYPVQIAAKRRNGSASAVGLTA